MACPAPLLLLLAAASPQAPQALQESTQDAAPVVVTPAEAVAGELGTWTLTVTLPQGLSKGATLRTQLPDSWHAGPRNSATPLQASDPTLENHVTARCSRPGVRLACKVEGERTDRLVKSARASVDGRRERYVFVVRVTLKDGALEAGDTVTVTYGDRSGGSPGMRAGEANTRPERALVELVPRPEAEPVLLAGEPVLQLRGGAADELWALGPSTLVVGQTALLNLAFVDHLANPATEAPGEVALALLEGEATLPASASLTGTHGLVEFTPRAEGVLRIQARAGSLEARSNPMLVHAAPPDQAVYWGDLHSHTSYSWDGVGDDSFAYGRDVARLDFYAATDHSWTRDKVGRTQGLGPHNWPQYTARTDAHHAPGRFVTLHAYECSMLTPYGHHIVYFRGDPGPLFAPRETSLPALWAALEEGSALTVPHHTGKFPPIDWEAQDPRFQRNFELYSAHGLSEALDREHPLAFEQSDFTAPGRSIDRPQYAQDAWARGLVLSSLAASDDHRAHPGQPHFGLTAVRASALTRDGIFDALHGRRTWATTGQRILLDFSVDGTPMGSRGELQGPASFELSVLGTDTLEWVDVLRWLPGEERFTVIETLRPEADRLQWTGEDATEASEAIYYVRVRQEAKVRGRAVMAWSSPVWVAR